MKRIGTVSYNIYCNFTNYGSALQTLLELFELSECMVTPEQIKELTVPQIDYQAVHKRIAMDRSTSKEFLMMELNLLEGK